MDQEKSTQNLSESQLLQKAANASSEGITISTMSEPDRPLIFVNHGFERLTGYSRAEVLGKNCRFLQGEGTDPMAVQRLREAIAKGESCTVELLNYKKNGYPFWNRLSITPIRDHRNIITHYVGIQSDITQLRETRAKLEAANKDLQTFRTRILKELNQAKLVQQFLLPAKLPSTPQVRFASLFVPMDEIGGDFFDVSELSNDCFGLLIADVTGHGIPAALLTFISSTTFKNALLEHRSPRDVISLTNAKLYQKMPDDAFVTMLYAVYDASRRVLTYTQAGHPEGYVIRDDGAEIIPLNTAGTIVGAFSADEVTYTEKNIQLLSGDKLVLYTDAITDALFNNETMDDEFRPFLAQNGGLSIEELFDRIYNYGMAFNNLQSYQDDFTLLGLEVLG